MSYKLENEEQERKLFVGGLNKESTDEGDLKNYFEAYGSIIDCTIMRDQDRISRGFGFVLFEDSSSIDKIISAKKDGLEFLLNEHPIQIKRALPKSQGGRPVGVRNEGLYRKIFVGGLPSSVTEEELQQYFETYGRVSEVELLRDRETSRLRGFAFVTFEDQDSADKCIQRRSHEICKKICEVKRAHTRSRDDRDDGRQDRHPGGRYDNRESRRPSQRFGGGAPAAGGVDMSEVNQLIQQAFMMGQQSIQPPTAASLRNVQPSNNVLLQALMNQQPAPVPPPVAPAPAPVAPANTSALMQLAQVLQSGGINANALGALLKGDAETSEEKTTTGYSSYDYSHNKTSSYGPSKDDSTRRYNPY